MFYYVWTVSSGGIVTSGGTSTSNKITITWSEPGDQSVSVNYTNVTGGTGVSAAVRNVVVNPLPVPTITGANSACAGATGVTYTTESGMTGYTWSVSAGGTITSGAGSKAITVTWDTPGEQTVSVNYTNGNGCSAGIATIKSVTVNPLPIPTITGVNSACAGTTGVTYTTESDMTGYTWSVSAGGTITSGAGSKAITVTWNTPGAQTVSVNYTNSNGCSAPTATSKNVTVNVLPVPVITGVSSVCAGTTGVSYSTEAGMSNYNWIVSSGGTVTAGAGTNSVTVTWNTAGPQTVSVNYSNANGCTAVQSTVKNVTVNPLTGNAGVITGTTSLCAGTQAVTYSIASIANATSYVWSVPTGATIASGSGTTSITVNYAVNAVSGNVTVYGSNGCGNGTTSTLAVAVTPLTAASGSISGPTAVCQGSTGLSFSVAPIANATSYTWSVPAGATIVSGANTRSIVVDLSMSTVSGQISVYGSNSCGKGAVSPAFNLIVNQIPATPVVSALGSAIVSTAQQGNQWYYSTSKDGAGAAITGATSQSYTPAQAGWYWTQSTVNGCLSDVSNEIFRLRAGEENRYNVYPVPNNGEFTVDITTSDDQEFAIIVYDQMGKKVYELPGLQINGQYKHVVNLNQPSTGIYSVVVRTKDGNVVKRKFNVNK
jgi:hypothetical protein